MAGPQPLKLVAVDEDDLQVISAHLQDAVIRIGQMQFSPKRGQFAFVANRFDWDGQAQRRPGKGERRATGVHFNRVQAVRSRKVRRDRADAVLSLLQIAFHPGDGAPAGEIELVLSGGGSIRLDVECIDAALEDLGPVWETRNVPRHDDG